MWCRWEMVVDAVEMIGVAVMVVSMAVVAMRVAMVSSLISNKVDDLGGNNVVVGGGGCRGWVLVAAGVVMVMAVWKIQKC